MLLKHHISTAICDQIESKSPAPTPGGAAFRAHLDFAKLPLRACLAKVRVKHFCGFWRTRRTYLVALFGRNAPTGEEATVQKQPEGCLSPHRRSRFNPSRANPVRYQTGSYSRSWIWVSE